jgi:putative endonuclease
VARDRRGAEKSGRKAELAAALYLTGKGYRILAERYRSPRGEIDLIAAKGTLAVMVEVKKRDTVTDAKLSVTLRQRARIEGAAEDWLATQKSPWSVRFDVIAIVPWRLPTHIKDAWRPGF